MMDEDAYNLLRANQRLKYLLQEGILSPLATHLEPLDTLLAREIKFHAT